jgi:hypothetical protein
VGQQRREWREPYTEEELEQFRDLIKFCSDKGVAFNYGTHPSHWCPLVVV